MIDEHSAAGKIAVVVLGGHHAGGSLLSHCLSLLGFAGPSDRAASPGDSAEAGEAGAVARLNNTILEDLGSAWDRPACFVVQGSRPSDSAPRVDEIVAQQYATDALAALQSAYGEARRIVIDDPPIALFPGLWDAALRAHGFQPRRVLVVRNPIEIAESLHRHHRLARPRAIQMWLRYTLSALSLAAARPEAVVSVEDLRQRKAQSVVDLAGGLGLGSAGSAPPVDEVNRFLDDALREDLVPSDVLFRSPLVSGLVKDTYRLCLDWHDNDESARSDAVTGLLARFEEFCLTAGALTRVPALALAHPPAVGTSAAPMLAAASGGTGRRAVIIHYHLFKNAGTSVDAILRRNFGPRWASQEYTALSARDMAEATSAFLLDHPEILALSSHTLLLPPPQLPDADIFPIIFVRHPLDRLKSAYSFERAQQADTEGARLAKQTDFAGYVRARLANPRERFCRNAQALRLAMADRAGGSERERALRAFAQLPFVGSVEAFDASIEALQRLLAPRFPGFRSFVTYENVSRPQRDLEERIAEIRRELGNDLFEALVAANSDDLTLYSAALARYRREPEVTVGAALASASA